jgi:MFS family permease
MVGLAASVQQSVTFVIGELAPMKDRYWISAALYTFGLPPAAFGPAIAYGFVLSTSAGWRWCYYLLIITNAVSTLCYFFFYHPPTFHMLTKESRWQQVKKIDYIGLFLFTGGLVVFLLGLTWGGAVYPWASAEVIASLSTGGVGLITFVLYECYASLAYPLVPMHLFRNTGEFSCQILRSRRIFTDTVCLV